MPFIAAEGKLINTELITDVVFREHGEHKNKAIAYSAGVMVSAESEAVYRYFRPIYERSMKEQQEAARAEKIQTGQTGDA